MVGHQNIKRSHGSRAFAKLLATSSRSSHLLLEIVMKKQELKISLSKVCGHVETGRNVGDKQLGPYSQPCSCSPHMSKCTPRNLQGRLLLPPQKKWFDGANYIQFYTETTNWRYFHFRHLMKIIKGSWEAILPCYEWLLLDEIDYDEGWYAI